jgi:EAL domain-containing protein (putative c-di-GMP-specific phosphodiesterase class I)
MDATRIARRIQASFKRPMQIDGRQIDVSVSIGIAVADPDLPDTATLLRNADAAMYRAKAAGKFGVEVFDRSMHEQAMTLLRLEADLHSALQAGQFHLLYQPIVGLESRELVGVEALLRWNHPEHGELVPDRFLKVAEETGQIVPIGLWVVREACRQLGRWRREVDDMDGLSVSVNVSYHQFRHPGFVEQIRTILEEEQVEPWDLELEISERILTLVAERDGTVIDQLLDLGVRLQLDDFGTGRTSLAFLSELPVHSLKIDQAFIGSRGFPQGREGIVDSMITLARELGVQTIAEGVETEAQADRLSSLGCDSAQGYYFSPPISPADLVPLLKKERRVQA